MTHLTRDSREQEGSLRISFDNRFCFLYPLLLAFTWISSQRNSNNSNRPKILYKEQNRVLKITDLHLLCGQMRNQTLYQRTFTTTKTKDQSSKELDISS